MTKPFNPPPLNAYPPPFISVVSPPATVKIRVAVKSAPTVMSFCGAAVLYIHALISDKQTMRMHLNML